MGKSQNDLYLNFWIEDSKGNKNLEIDNHKDKGSFTVPFYDDWTLKWENPHCIDDSYSTALELKYEVIISNQIPKALIQADTTSGPVSLTVSFTGNGIDYDGIIVSYHWDFGDGNTSNIKNPIYNFINTGTYIVTLTVTDDDGATGEDTEIITVNEI